MKKHLLSLFVSLVIPFSLSAVTITVNSVTGTWSNVTGSPSSLIGVGTNQINWGNSTGSGQSGYRFDGNAPPLYSVGIDTPFSLGNFTHFNQPITGDSITGATLNTTVNLTIDGTALSNLNFSYNFLHNETPNVAGTCAAGSVSVCDDIVQATNNVLVSDVFNINGVDYTLSILGFSLNGNFFTDFMTKEGKTNIASLQGVITRATVGVPDLSTYLTLATFLAIGVGVAYRRKVLA